ncbi:hypothetical protein HY772_06090 [Candidatus Woesearchaeota archaeon]|nr:hypothetical protein [Candidatus Woesearchaeota archaeon]
MRRISVVLILLILTSSFANCASLTESRKEAYGVLGSATTACRSAMIGKYGDAIPDDITAEQYLETCKGNISKTYYKALQEQSLDIESKKTYYLLKVYDPDTKSLILFDYSCTVEPDGKILDNPGMYDVNHLELYDPCKNEK